MQLDFSPLVQAIVAELRTELVHDEVLTTEQVCELFQVSRNEVASLKSRGLPCVKLGNGYRYSRSAVMTWFYAQSSETV